MLNKEGAPRATIETAACTRIMGSNLTLNGSVRAATSVEVSLNEGRSWSQAAVNADQWTFTTSIGQQSIYPVIMVRTRGDRIQFPVATLRLNIYSSKVYLPMIVQ